MLGKRMREREIAVFVINGVSLCVCKCLESNFLVISVEMLEFFSLNSFSVGFLRDHTLMDDAELPCLQFTFTFPSELCFLSSWTQFIVIATATFVELSNFC